MKTYNAEMSYTFNLLSVHRDEYENRNINSVHRALRIVYNKKENLW